MTLSGKYTIRTDKNGFSKIRIDGQIKSRKPRNRNVEFGLLTAMSTKSGGSQWAALRWDPNNGGGWKGYSSTNPCSLRRMKSCAINRQRDFKYDDTWTATYEEDRNDNSIKFSMVRDFDSDNEDLQLKLGEFYNFRAGFMAS